MPEPLTIVATVLGLVATGVAVAGQLWPRGAPAAPAPPAAPRETLVPSAPSFSSLPNAELAALLGRIVALEQREERAQGKREEMAASLTRIETLVSERTSRKDPRGNRDRESS